MIVANHTGLEETFTRTALLIRRTEERFLSLFAAGKLNGTVHTCLGQELEAVAFAGQLADGDFIVSSHRCHGHYIAFSGQCERLIAELLGKRTGLCGGVGSSQHLYDENFYSNGVQGGIMPLAAGVALARKFDRAPSIGVVFIGDGTLGEGAVYETLNLVSKWQLPLLIVCEHNGWAQSTDAEHTIAGDVLDRARAFGLTARESDVWHEAELFASARESIAQVRAGTPVFHLVRSFRLGPHSKGDDTRDAATIERYASQDRLRQIVAQSPDRFEPMLREIDAEIETAVTRALNDAELTLDEYLCLEDSPSVRPDWIPLESHGERVVESINRYFRAELAENPKAVFIGEDVLSPYGGAFKVARDLSDIAPDRVLSTPISESAIVGISNGLALGGYRPYAEIMFGDFITLAFDQLVNHASKFRHMYNHQVRCPLVVRTPMGGRRGYGPTHSQSLDRFLIGIDNVRVLAINALVEPYTMYKDVSSETDPVVVLENKVDYGKRLDRRMLAGYVYERESAGYPISRIRPKHSRPDLAIVAYGGMAEIAEKAALRLFAEHEVLASLIVPIQIHPLQLDRVVAALDGVTTILTLEEGNPFGGFGAELIAQLVSSIPRIQARRVGALAVPIPSVKALEELVLPNVDHVIEGALRLLGD